MIWSMFKEILSQDYQDERVKRKIKQKFPFSNVFHVSGKIMHIVACRIGVATLAAAHLIGQWCFGIIEIIVP